MLISFSVENFRSFRNQVTLRMDASSDSELPDVVRHGLDGVPPHFHGMLPVASIHGANASGKSNLIKAARLLDSMVDIANRFPDGRIPDDLPSGYLHTRNVDSFQLDGTSSTLPTSIEIVFVVDGVRWAYGLSWDVVKIHSEWLSYWPNGREVELFRRGNATEPDRQAFLLERSMADVPINGPRGSSPRIIKLDQQRWREGPVGSASPHEESWTWGNAFEKGAVEGQALAGRTRPEVPFLAVAASWNHPQAIQVMKWFSRFVIIDATQTTRRSMESIARQCDADRDVCEWVERWMRAADLGISRIEIEKTDERVEPVGSGISSFMQSRFFPKAVHESSDGRQISFDMQQESHGTNRLFALAVPLYRVLQVGGVLVVDELHAGLHPWLLRALVKIFQCPKRNSSNAQLIFTTHDVSVLDNSLLRRDQIHIVEKSRDGISDLYSISECDDKPRKDSPLIKYYLSGHLGGVPDLDIDAAFPLPNSILTGEQE